MKALSLTQPWASAVSHEIKRWETRSWPTHFRGEVAIHAAKGFPGWARDFADIESVEHRELDELPLGFILCLCNLTECRQTETLAPSLSDLERKWGDYSPRRYAFKFEEVRVLETPVPARGALGFWTVPDSLAALIREQLA
jgi:hypothetical protein